MDIKNSEQIHTQMLKMMLEGTTYEDMVGLLMKEGVTLAKIQYTYKHGVVSPHLPAVAYLLENRTMALSLQKKQEKLDAMSAELALAEKEREITMELAQRRALTTQTIEARRASDDLAITHSLMSTAKNVAQLALGRAGGILSETEGLYNVLIDKMRKWVKKLEDDQSPNVDFNVIKQGVGLFREIIRMTKESEQAGKLAAETFLLLKSQLPEGGEKSDMDLIVQTDSQLVAEIYMRRVSKSAGKPPIKVVPNGEVIDTTPTTENTAS